MINKKAQGLSLRTIIIAVLLLIVLVVMIMIFTGKIDWFNTGLEDCQSKGYECVESGKCKEDGGTLMTLLSCPEVEGENKKECCKTIS